MEGRVNRRWLQIKQSSTLLALPSTIDAGGGGAGGGEAQLVAVCASNDIACSCSVEVDEGRHDRVVVPDLVVDRRVPDDLVVRALDGRLIVDEPAPGPDVADGVWAHLSGARPLSAQIQAMIDRVQRQEVRS